MSDPKDVECCAGDINKCPALPLLHTTFPLILETAVKAAKAGTSTAAAITSLEAELKELRTALPNCPCASVLEVAADAKNARNTLTKNVRPVVEDTNKHVTALTKKKTLWTYLFKEGSGVGILQIIVPLLLGAGGLFGLQECSALLEGSGNVEAEQVSSSQTPAEGTVK
jgi:hypothetical protein